MWTAGPAARRKTPGASPRPFHRPAWQRRGRAPVETGLLVGVVPPARLIAGEPFLLLGVEVLLVAPVLQLLRVDPQPAEHPGVLLGVDLAHALQLLGGLLVVTTELTDKVHNRRGVEVHVTPFCSGARLHPAQAPARQSYPRGRSRSGREDRRQRSWVHCDRRTVLGRHRGRRARPDPAAGPVVRGVGAGHYSSRRVASNAVNNLPAYLAVEPAVPAGHTSHLRRPAGHQRRSADPALGIAGHPAVAGTLQEPRCHHQPGDLRRCRRRRCAARAARDLGTLDHQRLTRRERTCGYYPAAPVHGAVSTPTAPTVTLPGYPGPSLGWRHRRPGARVGTHHPPPTGWVGRTRAAPEGPVARWQAGRCERSSSLGQVMGDERCSVGGSRRSTSRRWCCCSS